MHVQSVQKILFFIVKYANLWGLCCRRRRGCLSSLVLYQLHDHNDKQQGVIFACHMPRYVDRDSLERFHLSRYQSLNKQTTNAQMASEGKQYETNEMKM